MRTLLSIALLLTGLVGLPAQVKVAGDRTVPEHKLVRLAPELKADEQAIFDVFPYDSVDIDERGGRLIFTGPPGKYFVSIRVINFKTQDIRTERLTVIIGDSPAPPPPDVPVPPSDALLAALQPLYAADASPTKKTDAQRLAHLFTVAGETTVFDANLKTLGQLYNVISTATRGEVPLPRLDAVRNRLAAENQKALGVNPDAPLDTQTRDKASAHFKRIGKVMQELAK